MTIPIIILTVLISISAFPPSIGSIDSLRRDGLFDKFKFNAYMVFHRKEWFRLFSHGLIHADWMHLGFNMLALHFVGDVVQQGFEAYFGKMGIILFLLVYILALPASSVASLAKHKNNSYYNAVGASGAVSAILFSAILLAPTMEIFLFFIPIGIPGFIFGPLYLLYSHYMSTKNYDNIGHDAHFWGAVFGFITPCLFKPELILIFIAQIIG